jgi:hypothetical protein
LKRQGGEARLYELAAQQGGFFTTGQAKASGYADNTHPHHVRAGNWIRERRGIYRLARFPLAARPDLMLWPPTLVVRGGVKWICGGQAYLRCYNMRVERRDQCPSQSASAG